MRSLTSVIAYSARVKMEIKRTEMRTLFKSKIEYKGELCSVSR